MAKKLQVISAYLNPRVASAAGGNSITAAKAFNTLAKIPIGAAATSIVLLVQNTNTIYWTPPADGTDIRARFGFQAYDGETPKTGSWTQITQADYSSGQTYTLDHRLRTVARSTGGDARPDLGAASIFFDLALGNNTIDIAVSNCTVGTTTLSWRSRWP